jgi:hypothetical protein
MKTLEQIKNEGYRVVKVKASHMFLSPSCPIWIEEYSGKYGTGYEVHSLDKVIRFQNNKKAYTSKLSYYVK